MTDDVDRLRRELRAARPRETARVRGIEAAMAAFEEEFSEKSDTASQGNVTELRPTPKKVPDDRAPDRRGHMKQSLISRNAWMLGGTAIAASLAAFIVVQNDFRPQTGFTELYGIDGDGDDVGVGSSEVTAVLDSVGNAPPPAALPAAQVEGARKIAAGRPPIEIQLDRSSDAEDLLREEAAPSAIVRGPVAESERLESAFAGRADPMPQDEAAPRQSRRSATAPSPVVPGIADAQPGVFREQGRDRFAAFTPNSVERVANAPVSTFSVDVDTASYSFLRASLNQGRIPPADAIRVEEMINYFPYGYEAPTDPEEPFKAHVSVMPTPWNAGTKLLHIGIKGYVPPADERPRSNIVLLIDTSGSMNAPGKLPLLINSFRLLLGSLDEDDTVSIVTYAGSAGLVLEPTPASDRRKIEAALNNLRAGGSTAGGAGLALAYDTARDSFIEDGINRVILATDGDFNVGYSSPEEMKRVIEEKRESGVFLSVLGFGMGNLNDALMQALAQNGNGVAAYIDTLAEARKVLADEAGGSLVPIAKDVKIQVEFNPSTITEYRLIGYETRALRREDFNNDAVDAGEINAGHTVTALYEIVPTGSPAQMIDELRYAQAETETASDDASNEYAFVKIRHKLPDADVSTLQTRTVTRQDEFAAFGDAGSDARFAAAVSAFGQKLQASPHLRGFDYDEIESIAAGARGEDPSGYRGEFLGLVGLAKVLDRP